MDRSVQKKSVQPVAATNLVIRGRSDSINSNDSMDLGIKSEKSSIHERTTPTKPNVKSHGAHSESNVKASGDTTAGVSLPELRSGAQDYRK